MNGPGQKSDLITEGTAMAYVDDGHRGTQGLAADLVAARDIVQAMPLAPTVVLGTGGGVQAHWCFPMLMPVDDASIDVVELCEGWVRLARSIAVECGAPRAVD